MAPASDYVECDPAPMLKKMLDRLGGALLVGIVRLRLRLSEPAADRVALFLSWLARHAVPSRRRIAERNVRRAFGKDKDAAETALIVRQAYRHAVTGFSDALLLFKEGRDRFAGRVEVEGAGNLERARAAGRGVIGVSAHYGSFPLLGPALAARGVPFHFLYRVPKNASTAALFDDWLTRGGCRVIVDTPRHLAGLRCLKALAEGAVVCILIDQHYAAGVTVPFLGQPSRTGIGAALLAARSGAPLLPMVLRRTGPGRHILRLEPALPPPPDRSRESLTRCMEDLTRTIEGWIRDDPSQWFWIHRRWKDLDRLEDERR